MCFAVLYCCFDVQLGETGNDGIYITLCGRMHEKSEKILKSLVEKYHRNGA